MRAKSSRFTAFSALLALLSCPPAPLFGNELERAFLERYAKPNFRPITLKKHTEAVCEVVWNEVRKQRVLAVGGLSTFLIPTQIETYRLIKNYSEKELCNCVKKNITGNDYIIMLVREPRRLSYEVTLAERNPESFKKYEQFTEKKTKEYAYGIARSQGRETPNEKDTSSGEAQARKKAFEEFAREFERVGVSERDLSRAREIKVPSSADKLYTGLARGSYMDLSYENQGVFKIITSQIEDAAVPCLIEAAKKGN